MTVLFSGVVWASVGVTVMTVSVTRAASMAPANNPGNVTARRDGVGSSATRVSLLRDLLLQRDPLGVSQPLLFSYLNSVFSKTCFSVDVSRSELLHTP